MKVICPNNAKHNRFEAVAFAPVVWEVDSQGQFRSQRGHSPEVIEALLDGPYQVRLNSRWTCLDCLASVRVTD